MCIFFLYEMLADQKRKIFGYQRDENDCPRFDSGFAVEKTLRTFLIGLKNKEFSVEVLNLIDSEEKFKVYFDVDDCIELKNKDEEKHVDIKKIFDFVKNREDVKMFGYYNAKDEDLDDEMFECGLTEYYNKELNIYKTKDNKIFIKALEEPYGKRISVHLFFNRWMLGKDIYSLSDFRSNIFNFDPAVYNKTQNFRSITSNKPVSTKKDGTYVFENQKKKIDIVDDDLLKWSVVQYIDESTTEIKIDELVEILELTRIIKKTTQTNKTNKTNKTITKISEYQESKLPEKWEDCCLDFDNKRFMLHYLLYALVKFDVNRKLMGDENDYHYFQSDNTHDFQSLIRYISLFRMNTYFEDELYNDEFSIFHHNDPKQFMQPAIQKKCFDISPIEKYIWSFKTEFQVIAKKDLTIGLFNEWIRKQNIILRKKHLKLIEEVSEVTIDEDCPEKLTYSDLEKYNINIILLDELKQFISTSLSYIKNLYMGNFDKDLHCYFDEKYSLKRPYRFIIYNQQESTFYWKDEKYKLTSVPKSTIIENLNNTYKEVKKDGNKFCEYLVCQDKEEFENIRFNYNFQKPIEYDENISNIKFVLDITKLYYEDKLWYNIYLSHHQYRLKNKCLKTPFNFIHTGDSNTCKSYFSTLFSNLYYQSQIIGIDSLGKEQLERTYKSNLVVLEELMRDKRTGNVVQIIKKTRANRLTSRSMGFDDKNIDCKTNWEIITNDEENIAGLFDNQSDIEAMKNRFILLHHIRPDEYDIKTICNIYKYDFTTTEKLFEDLYSYLLNREFIQSFKYYLITEDYFIQDHKNYINKRNAIKYNMADKNYSEYERNFFNNSEVIFPDIDSINGIEKIYQTNNYVISDQRDFFTSVRLYMIDIGIIEKTLNAEILKKLLGKDFSYIRKDQEVKIETALGVSEKKFSNNKPIIINLDKYCEKK